MKRILIIIFLIYPIITFSQEVNKLNIPFNKEKDVFLYDTIFIFNNIDTTTIYNKTKEFISQKFKTQLLHIDVPFKNISCKGYSYISTDYQNIVINNPCTFNFTIYIKENRCRVLIDEITISASTSGDSMGTRLESYLDNLENIPFTGKKMAKKMADSLNENIIKLLSNYQTSILNNKADSMYNF